MTYPNLVVPIGSIALALESITSGERGRVVYKGKIYKAKALEDITEYKEVVVADETTPRGVVEVKPYAVIEQSDATKSQVEIHQPTTKEQFQLEFQVPTITTITWTDTGVDTDVAPDTDTEIDVEQARSIAIQIDSTHASNTSTDFDVNVESTLDGTTWDTVPYAEANVGDNEVKTFLVEPGVKTIRLRGDNNAAGTTGYITARVKVRK